MQVSQDIPIILQDVKNRGFRIFARGDYNLNIIAERVVSGLTNLFDDYLHACYPLEGKWVHEKFMCTTDPGRYHVFNSTKGVATLQPGQYFGTWRIGLHQGKYPALVQAKPVKVWRDRNRNGIPDDDLITDTGIFGINIHHATSSGASRLVDKWSAGCIVLAESDGFARFMELCNKSAEKFGNHFTVTLIES
jgi:hypothetical protein